MSDPLGPIQIGAREIYDQLVSTDRKVDTIIAAHAEVIKDLGDHESRIRALERGRWPLPSLAALFGLASLIVAILSLTLK
ncbi:hypothetical protein HS041_22325 [Planomonospora sp. ID67723]|uniref:hypothetical protein n=1 Tax=Planomonospora sp. ID67723 TaxID=2738134 RepID=UPI0018C42435|nr:hypothetical protein [Planomonospora sp. ID67723]MBG0830501.1 hypothetical protein [Planomonospora sp. ID67723]